MVADSESEVSWLLKDQMTAMELNEKIYLWVASWPAQGHIVFQNRRLLFFDRSLALIDFLFLHF